MSDFLPLSPLRTKPFSENDIPGKFNAAFMIGGWFHLRGSVKISLEVSLMRTLTPSKAEPRTCASLLGRLARVPADPAAWEEFTQHYGRKVYRWCRRWNVQPADAEDVTQTVLMEVARQINRFSYDPTQSFRAWLKTLTHHTWCDWLEASRRAGTPAVEQLATLESRDDLLQQLEQEHRRQVLEEAAVRVRLRVDPRTWEAFSAVAIEGLSGAEAAARLGLSVGAVYVARCKIQKWLRDEARKLDPDA
jgi:RNA polymerase sigma factor (sigma-70 family)